MATKNVGFRFADVHSTQFQDKAAFLKGVAKWDSRRELLDATDMTAVSIDGDAVGTGARLTSAAFANVCALVGIPQRFVSGLTKRNEALALELLRDALSAGLLKGCVLIVDTESRTVLGATRENRYNPPDVQKFMKVALSYSRETEFLGGWVNGAEARLTVRDGPLVDVKSRKEAKVGDLVGLGFEVVVNVGPGGSTTVTDYMERLVCLNGMLARSNQMQVKQEHEGFDLNESLLRALVQANTGARAMLAMANDATKHFFDGKGVKAVRELIADSDHPAASESLSKHATQRALVEATNDGRKPGEICLWDFVNGVTDAAKHSATLEIRQHIEDFGHTVMATVLDW